MRKSSVALASIVLVIAAIAGWLFYRHEQTAYLLAWGRPIPTAREALYQDVLNAWEKRDDFEGATRVALDAVQGEPSDDLLYALISDTYFERAQSEPSRRGEFTSLAVQYSERSLAANPSDLINVYDLAHAYETAGMNHEGTAACEYYRKSEGLFRSLLANQVLSLRTAMIGGQQVDVGLYRRKGNDTLREVQQFISLYCSASYLEHLQK